MLRDHFYGASGHKKDRIYNWSLRDVLPSVFFSITEIQTVSPQGFIKSDLAKWKVASNTWYVNVSYVPERKEPGPEFFCYTALSNSR